MASEQELKNNSLQKEFQNLLDQDFKDRKIKENEIIKATVTEVTKNFIVCDLKLKQEAMIPIEEFKNDDELSKIKVGKIFKWLKTKNISDDEMIRTFNCGVGFCVITHPRNIKKIKNFFSDKYKPYEIGYISNSNKRINLYKSLKW